MTVKSYLLWIAIFLLILLTGGGEDKVRCVEGDTCTLPCSFKPGTVLELHWTHTERDDPVHSYYSNKDQVEDQDKRFKGRTSLPKDLSTGDASLQLRKVQVQDQGRYKCTVKTTERKYVSVINLEVKGPCPSDSVNGSQAETTTTTTTSSSGSVSALKNVTTKIGNSTGDEQTPGGGTPSKSTGVIAGVVVGVVLLVVVALGALAVYCYKKRGQRGNNQDDAENGTEMEALNRPPQPSRSTECPQ